MSPVGFAKFFPQCSDVDIDCAFKRSGVFAPRRFHQFIAGKRTTRLGHQSPEHAKLSGGQFQFTRPNTRPRGSCDRFRCRAFGVDFFRLCCVSATQQRLNAMDQRLYTKRFCDVIVRTHIETDNFVGFGTASRQHHDQSIAFGTAVRLELSTDLQTIDSGEHQIEHAQIGNRGCESQQPTASVSFPVNGIAFLLQVVDDDIGNGLFIFNDKNVRCCMIHQIWPEQFTGLQSRMPNNCSLDQIHDIFCDIRCVVSNSFDMTNDRKQMQTWFHEFWSLFHHVDNFTDQ